MEGAGSSRNNARPTNSGVLCPSGKWYSRGGSARSMPVDLVVVELGSASTERDRETIGSGGHEVKLAGGRRGI